MLADADVTRSDVKQKNAMNVRIHASLLDVIHRSFMISCTAAKMPCARTEGRGLFTKRSVHFVREPEQYGRSAIGRARSHATTGTVTVSEQSGSIDSAGRCAEAGFVSSASAPNSRVLIVASVSESRRLPVVRDAGKCVAEERKRSTTQTSSESQFSVMPSGSR